MTERYSLVEILSQGRQLPVLFDWPTGHGTLSFPSLQIGFPQPIVWGLYSHASSFSHYLPGGLQYAKHSEWHGLLISSFLLLWNCRLKYKGAHLKGCDISKCEESHVSFLPGIGRIDDTDKPFFVSGSLSLDLPSVCKVIAQIIRKLINSKEPPNRIKPLKLPLTISNPQSTLIYIFITFVLRRLYSHKYCYLKSTWYLQLFWFFLVCLLLHTSSACYDGQRENRLDPSECWISNR